MAELTSKDLWNFIQKTKHILPKDLMVIRHGLLADLVGITRQTPPKEQDIRVIRKMVAVINLRLRVFQILQFLGWN